MTNMWNETDFLHKLSEMVHEYACIGTEEIPFRQYVVDACAKNYCGQYGKTWQCPPGIGEFEELRKKCLEYKKAMVFTTFYPLEDSFDIEGMEEGRKTHVKITDNVIQLFSGKKIRVLSAEGCGLCEQCTYPDAPCRFPDKAKSSVEANGISVVELAQKCGMHYKNGENTVTYFSLILY